MYSYYSQIQRFFGKAVASAAATGQQENMVSFCKVTRGETKLTHKAQVSPVLRLHPADGPISESEEGKTCKRDQETWAAQP